MAKTSILTMSASIGGDGEQVSYTPPGMPLSNTACPQGGPVVTNLFQGDNTIQPFSGAVGVLIVPTPGNTATLKLKGAGGDTGITLHLTAPMFLPLGVVQGAFIVNVSGPTSCTVMWI